MTLRFLAPLLTLALILAGPGTLTAQWTPPPCGIGIVSSGDNGVRSPGQPWGDTLVQDHLIIREVMPGSPAEKSGLQEGDEIIQINDRNVGGMKLSDALSLLRGTKGTVVKITLIRQGESGALSFTITRDVLDIPARR